MERCVRDVGKDIAQFNLSVRSSVNTGLLTEGFGEKSLKQTSSAIRNELGSVQDKMFELQGKLSNKRDEESDDEEEEEVKRV